MSAYRKICRVINLDYIFVWNIIWHHYFGNHLWFFEKNEVPPSFFFVEMLGAWGAGMLEGLNEGRAVAFP